MATQEQKIIFKAIETVLISYNKYKNRIKKDLEYFNNPVLLKSYSLEKISGSGFVEVKSDIERMEDLKAVISKDIGLYEAMIFRIDSALDMVKDNEDYDLIEVGFLENNFKFKKDKVDYEQIAEKLNISVKTVYQKRNRIFPCLEFHFRTQDLIQVKKS